MAFLFILYSWLRFDSGVYQRHLGTWLPDVIGAAAGWFGVAGLPGALRDGPGAVGEQLIPEVAGETSRAVW